jgi:alpha-beta hydrolase superfamily lysophospholipase
MPRSFEFDESLHSRGCSAGDTRTSALGAVPAAPTPTASLDANGARAAEWSQPARPLYLNGADEGVFALFHDPPGQRRDTAVLFCPPFGWDATCPYRRRRDWAEHLRALGYPALRIDLPGSGDSAGNPGDPERVEVWTQAVSAAARWLKAATGASRVVAVGVGLGGLIAYRAAYADAPIDDLVLLAVSARGHSLVRELHAHARLPTSSAPAPDQLNARTVPDGAVLAVGYLMSAETVSALEDIDLSELTLPHSDRRRVLMLGRSGPIVDQPLRGSLEAAGADVTVGSGPGFGPIGDVLERVDAWLAQGESDSGRRNGQRDPRASQAPLSAVPEDAPSDDHLPLIRDAVELRETPLYLERPGGRLFGVLTEPVDAHQELCAVLLNAGPQRHTGPGRMWVEIARRWAARGVPTLRIDLACIGDSDGDGTKLENDDILYEPEYIEETCAALEMLAARGLPPRFVLLGLCSGAYWSLQAALRDKRIAAMMMINPRVLIWDPRAQAARDARLVARRMLQSSTRRNLLHGEITPRRFLQVARSLTALAGRTALTSPQRLASSIHNGGSPPDPLELLLDTLRDRDQRALMVLTGWEPIREELATNGLLDNLDRWPNLEVAAVDASVATHMLTPLWLQHRVHGLVDEALDRELERVRPAAVPA